MSAERVRLFAAPVDIERSRPLVARPDPVAPVIIVGKATARPAKNRNVKLLKSLKNVFEVSSLVWNSRVWTDPQPTIDASAKMFRKLPLDFGRDHGIGLCRIHGDSCLCRARCGCNTKKEEESSISHT